MMSQRDEVYEAEDYDEWRCADEAMDVASAQSFATEAIEWAKTAFGIHRDLSVRVEVEVTEGTSAEIAVAMDADDRAAEVSYLWLPGDRMEATIYVYTMFDIDTGYRTVAREHLILHELAHAVVGEWPNWVHDDEGWALSTIGPDRHGALFARRHLDLVERFHPNCLPVLADAYDEFGVEVAPVDADPASFWNLPRPSEAELHELSLEAGRGNVRLVG